MFSFVSDANINIMIQSMAIKLNRGLPKMIYRRFLSVEI